jgi:hypothetical protein
MNVAIDPYRTLGLPPAASLDQVKQAYRRLAKQYHPDAAGDEAAIRFLAVQAAYEAILAGATSRGGPGGRPGSARPWQADPARARATRDAYRARSSAWRSTDGAAAGGSAAGGAAAGGSAAGGPAGRNGAGATDPDRHPGAGRRSRRSHRAPGAEWEREGATDSRGPADGPASRKGRRPSSRKKATLTSTSYDEAARGPFEPDWDGGSWYGTSSGTYWTINPKEYADPRKHGPEYQARARRATSGRASRSREPDPATTWAGTTSDPAAATGPTANSRETGTGPAAPSASARTEGVPDPRPGRAGEADPFVAPPTSPGAASGGHGAPWARQGADARPWDGRAVVAEADASPLSAGLTAGAIVAIPSGIVLVLAAAAGVSAIAGIAIAAPPIAALAVAASASIRGRGRRAP